MDEDEILKATQSWWDDPTRAIEALRGYLHWNPRSVRARLRLAAIYADEREEGTQAAERLLREVLADDATNVTALSRLGLLQGHPGSHVTATESLSLLSKAAQLSVELWTLENLANKAWDTCNSDTALAAYMRLLTLAEAQGAGHMVKIAEAAIKAIRRGEVKSRITGYSAPEI